MTGILKNQLGINSAWTDAGFIQSSFNSGANGTFWLAASKQVGSLDLWAEVYVKAYVGGTVSSGGYFAVWVMPELPDGNFGDGVTNGTGLPNGTLFVDNIGVKAGVTSGSAVYGMTHIFPIPIDGYKFGVSQHLGIALNATSSVSVLYRTRNLNLNG